MLTLETEEVRPALQCQADRRKITSTVIIPRDTENNSIFLCGFIGSIKEFRHYLNAQRFFLNSGVISP